MNKEPMKTTKQIAAELGYSPQHTIRLAEAGILPGIRVGSSWRFDPEKVQQALEEATIKRRLNRPIKFNKMNNDTNDEDSMPATVTFPPESIDLLRRIVPEFMERTGYDWNETVCLMTIIGLTALQKESIEEKQHKIKVFKAINSGDVDRSILALKMETEISSEEIDMIFHAAKEGHLGAKIIMSDIRRFGKSM